MNVPGLPAGTEDGGAIPGKAAEKALLIFVVVCLGVPAALTRLLDVEIPLSALACLISVPFYFLIPNIPEKFYITAAFVLSLISVLFNAVFVSDRVEMSPFLSMVYFFSPYPLFFSGYALIRDERVLSRVLQWFSGIFAVVSILVVSGILASGGMVRVDGELLGSLLGLKLYATYGVNSLAVFFATMFAIVVIHVFYGGHYRKPGVVFHLAGMAALLFLMIGSLSREAVLGCGLFILLSGMRLAKENPLYGLLSAGVAGTLAYTVADRYGEAIGLIWASKLGVSVLGEGDLDAFSSGRITLYRYAIKDILTNPIFGNGFHGFFLHHPPGLHANAIAGNNSPHNQFLTAIWKMGLLAGGFYLLFLYKCMKNLYLLRRWGGGKAMFAGLWVLMVVYVLVFCSFWDVLLVPLIGMFLMFLLGGTARIFAAEKRAGLGY